MRSAVAEWVPYLPGWGKCGVGVEGCVPAYLPGGIGRMGKVPSLPDLGRSRMGRSPTYLVGEGWKWGGMIPYLPTHPLEKPIHLKKPYIHSQKLIFRTYMYHLITMYEQ